MTLGNDICILQRNLSNTSTKDQVKPLKINKDEDDVAKETCLARESRFYYALRTKHYLRGWQYNKHKYKYLNNNKNYIYNAKQKVKEHTSYLMTNQGVYV